MNLKSQLLAAVRDCFDVLMNPNKIQTKRKEIKNEKLIKCLLVCGLHWLKKKNQIKKRFSL